jgi:L-alanine-DL-glutamate epimerase-like enolase superfamily enzyme
MRITEEECSISEPLKDGHPKVPDGPGLGIGPDFEGRSQR